MFACGPYFPNTLLDGGNSAVLVAPTAVFRMEIERMKLVPTGRQTVPATNGRAHQTLDAELDDLRRALDRTTMGANEREAIITRHQAERQRILWQPAEAAVLRPGSNDVRILPSAPPRIAAGLPGEFADYFRGAVAWHGSVQGSTAAVAAWQDLLARPAGERHFKSTWAAFMLGKAWEEDDPEKAISCFQSVRTLARAGFADSLGLAASSLGWEARLHLRQKRFSRAFELYLEQAAAGDDSTVNSLRFTASAALQEGTSALRLLASHPQAQRVITAYVISGGWDEPPIDVDGVLKESVARLAARAPFLRARANGWHRRIPPVLLWLEAVEAAGVKDLDSAEQLALAAYQAGEMEQAQRWINRARTTPVLDWLQAKLYLRAGRIENAAALLSKVSRRFVVEPWTNSTNRMAGSKLQDSLYLGGRDFERTSVGEQALGELGVLRLARRQYTEALDALLRSGFWMDAAYVAERVLTLEELKSYVERHWTAKSVPATRTADSTSDVSPTEAQFDPGTEIRHLLARRLLRSGRPLEARVHFPDQWRKAFDDYHQSLQNAENMQLSAAQRAGALFAAAQIVRAEGLDLVGTEVEPDWRIHGGNYEEGVSVASRAATSLTTNLVASAEELRRAAQHGVDPDERFHYRYTAANLAWNAARLMPNNSDETARVLCTAGSWLKVRDPAEADRFYKALVRRCRKTAIGAEADRRRWFPILDEAGNLKAPSPVPQAPGIDRNLEPPSTL